MKFLWSREAQAALEGVKDQIQTEKDQLTVIF